MIKTLPSMRRLFVFGLVSSLCAMMHIAAGILPETGHFVSAFATLPLAVQAGVSPFRGILAYLASSWIILSFQPDEMPVFALTTGPLGWILGWSRHYCKRRLEQLLWGALLLFAGMMMLTYGVGIPALGDLVWGSPPFVWLTFLLFAIFYTHLWIIFFSCAWKRLDGIRAFRNWFG